MYALASIARALLQRTASEFAQPVARRAIGREPIALASVIVAGLILPTASEAASASTLSELGSFSELSTARPATVLNDTVLYLPRIELRQNETTRLVGRIGGTTRAVVATTEYVLAGVDDQVVSFEVASDGAPEILGATPALGGDVVALAAAGSRCYAALGPAGLRTLDVSDPSRPRPLTQLGLGGPVVDVAFGRDFVFALVAGAELVAIDVSNHHRPQVVARLGGFHQASSVAWAADHVYVAQQGDALLVIDVAEPANPTLKGRLDDSGQSTSGQARDVVHSAGFAYVATIGAGIRVVDVTDPGSPKATAYVAPGSRLGALHMLGRVLVGADESAGLITLDATDPAAPVPVGSIEVQGGLFAVSGRGERVVAGSARSNLAVFGVSDPHTPQHLGEYTPPRMAAAVALTTDRVYAVFGEPFVGLAVGLPRPIAHPHVAGYLSLVPEGQGPAPSATDIQVVGKGRSAYLLYYDALLAVNAFDPTGPIIERLLALPGARAMASRGQYLFVTGYGWRAGLRVIDVGSPGNPEVVYERDEHGDGKAIAIEGQRLYLVEREVTGQRGTSLILYDVDTPWLPIEIGALPDIGNTVGIAVSGNIVYQGHEAHGVHVFDAGRPDHIVRLGTYQVQGTVTRLEAEGDRLYVVVEHLEQDAEHAEGGRLVHVVDVSNPALPNLEQVLRTDGEIFGMAVDDRLLHIGASDSGMLVYDVPPAVPEP